MILKPWEIAPLGSIVKAFVHEVDGRRKRIGLTTYAPEQWNDMLPMKVLHIIILLYCYYHFHGVHLVTSHFSLNLFFLVRKK